MIERHHRWLGPALRVQCRITTASFTGFCALAIMGLRFDFGLQVAILLAGIVLVGFPHGAFDHLVARPVLLPWLGSFWWLHFLFGYLGLAGLVWLGWMFAPATTLALFLAGSVMHFGLGDTEDGLLPDRVPRLLGLISYGALPILLPIALHPAEVAPVLAVMAGWDPPVMQRVLSGTIWLVPAWALAFGWIMSMAWREKQDISERLATAAGFMLLPPMLSFGLYFGLGHSVRHVLRLGAWRDAAQPKVAARWSANVMLPASAVCAAGLVGLAWLNDDTTRGLLAPAFRIISALTLPHMIVTACLESALRRPPRVSPHSRKT